MTNAVAVYFQGPARAFTLKPIGTRLNDPRSNQIVSYPGLIDILVKDRNRHSGRKQNLGTILVQTVIIVRETKCVSEETIKIGS